ncbi:Holliday junction branch migration protein RuvA [Patescibacteria group bacterium]|nr:Holliday junction branch migration protein RuvA [Patescibacteria group bacterium]
MIYTVSGLVSKKKENFLVVESYGVGFKIFSNSQTIYRSPKEGESVKVYCHTHVKEDAIELYGFLDEGELGFFEMLISVSGVGPKTALLILDLDSFPNVMAAIVGKKADVLSRASGVGKKTAERIILELHSKINISEVKGLDKATEVNIEVEDALVGLGYDRSLIKRVLGELKESPESSLENKLKSALKVLGNNKK